MSDQYKVNVTLISDQYKIKARPFLGTVVQYLISLLSISIPYSFQISDSDEDEWKISNILGAGGDVCKDKGSIHMWR